MIIAVCAIALQSCKSKPSEADVQGIAKDFLDAMKNENYDKAMELATDDTDKMLEQAKMFSGMVPDSLQEEQNARIAAAKSSTITMGAATFSEDGTEATVKFTSSLAPEQEETITLKKVDKNWLADLGASIPSN